MKDEVFPIGLHLSGRRVVVVGGGAEAERRAAALLEAGAIVACVSEAPSAALRELLSSAGAELREREFVETDLDGAWLAVSTDMDPSIAERVMRAAEARAVFSCAVDQPSFGSFSHMALARVGGVTVSISTSGRAPSLARRLREEIFRLLAEADVGAFVERLAALRARTPSAERHRVLGAAVRDVRIDGALRLPPPGDRQP